MDHRASSASGVEEGHAIADRSAGAKRRLHHRVAEVFAADAPQNVQDYLAATIKPEPLAPLATPVQLTENNFGSIQKVYIHTLNDNTISYPAQKHMVNGSDIDVVYSLASSHTPFISMPDELAEIILKESK